jgi:hypothetical protein
MRGGCQQVFPSGTGLARGAYRMPHLARRLQSTPRRNISPYYKSSISSRHTNNLLETLLLETLLKGGASAPPWSLDILSM